MSVEQRLAELGLQLPIVSKPKGLYKPVVVVGSLAYTSGHLPTASASGLITGRLGQDMDQQAGYTAAQLTGLSILATLKAELGSLDRVRRVVKILGLVQCTDDFTAQPAVINGCSELFAEVFGPDRGVGARSAFGVNALPLGVPVEIEAIFEIEA
jgi:enamine deaminase RidA (YjgF/YER057c/UK114 family)